MTMSMPNAPALWFSAANASRVTRIDLIIAFGGSARALEAVHTDDRAGTGHVLELAPHLVGIVGERVDLLARQRGAERRAPPIRRGLLRVLPDGDVLRTFWIRSTIVCRLSPARSRTFSTASVRTRRTPRGCRSGRRQARDLRDALR